MSENKMCNYCNKTTVDEVVKGEVFCIECGHHREMIKASVHQERETERKKRTAKWRNTAIWCLGLVLAMTIKNGIESNNRAKRMEQTAALKNTYVETQAKVKNNFTTLSQDDINQLTYLTQRSREIVANNLKEQDKNDFLRLTTPGRSDLTFEEGAQLIMLMQKSKNGMSLEDRKIVEEFEQKSRMLLK